MDTFSSSVIEDSRSIQWMAVSINFCIFQALAEPLRRQLSGYCQQALVGIHNRVWFWWLFMGWIPRWGSLWMAFPSVSAPHFVSVTPFMGLKKGNKIITGGKMETRCGAEMEGKAIQRLPHLGIHPIYSYQSQWTLLRDRCLSLANAGRAPSTTG